MRDKSQASFLVVILARNEEQIIAEVIQGVRKELEKISSSFSILVWDSSSDSTAQRAQQVGAEVLRDEGWGLGWSYYKMLQYCRTQKSFDVLITMDGDGQVDPGEIPFFLQEWEKGQDLVVGSRFLNHKDILYSYPRINRWGVWVLSKMISLASQKKFTDSHGGLRVMDVKVLGDFYFLGTHSYVQETLIQVVRSGFSVKEVASVWNPRLHGESRVVHSPFRYARRMSLPLLWRLKAHWFLGALLLALALIFQDPFVLLTAVVIVVGMEFWGLFRLQKNFKKLQDLRVQSVD